MITVNGIERPDALIKVADKINEKRRKELFNIYNDSDLLEEVAKLRESGVFDKGNKSKSMRKIATIPLEVDIFFTKMYGENYYKDPAFFKTKYTEWAVVKPINQ